MNNNNSNYNLNNLLRAELEPQDQFELGLITYDKLQSLLHNPIINIPSNQQLIQSLYSMLATPDTDIIKQTLSFYEDEADELGINYAGSLTAEDEPSIQELTHALDDDTVINTPEKKRSNFWYIEKTYNPHDKYTRYILANGSERIITDDELSQNPYLQYKRELSDAREDGDFELYNQLKQQNKAKFLAKYNKPDSQPEQCRLKIWSKELNTIFNLPMDLIEEYNKAKHLFNEHQPIQSELQDDMLTRKQQIYNKAKRKLLSYLDMVNVWVNKLIKADIKIKIKNVNNKTIAVI